MRKLYTLTELLLVVSILAILSSAVIATWDGLILESTEKLVKVEMEQIRDAILRFKQDTGYFPTQGPFEYGKVAMFNALERNIANSPTVLDEAEKEQWLRSYANFSQLAVQPKDEKGEPINKYNIDTQRGWNGPYISRNFFKLISITKNSIYMPKLNPSSEEDYEENFTIFLDKIDEPPPLEDEIITQVWTIVDKFSSSRIEGIDLGKKMDNLNVYKNVDFTSNESKNYFIPSVGKPYLLFINPEDLGASRIISAGPNGLFKDKDGKEDNIIVYLN